MKKNIQLYSIVLLLSVIIGACGHNSKSSNFPIINKEKGSISYTGDFLSWTGGSDVSHYFTLVRVNGQTGNVTTIGGTGFFTGLAYAPDGRLYGVSSKLCIVNPADGTTTKVGDLVSQGTTTPILMAEAAFSPDGRLFVAENAIPPRIFTVDLSTGSLTLIGTLDPATIAMGLEFSADGTLYASFGNLYTLNPADASTISKVGSTGGPLIANLTFGNGIMFGTDIQSTHIYSLDLGNGQASIVTAVTSTGLVSLVPERTPAVYPAAMHKTAAKEAAPDIETLLNMENEIKRGHLISK